MGEIAERDIIAPFDFPVLKSEDELVKDREFVLSNSKPVLSYDIKTATNSLERIQRFFSTIDSLSSSKLDSAAFAQIMKANYPLLSDYTIVVLHNPRSVHALLVFDSGLLDTLILNGIYPSLANLPLEESGLVTIDKEGQLKTIVREQVFDLDKAHWYITVQANGAFSRKPSLIPAAREIAQQFLEPNLVFDKGITEANKNLELASITGEKGWVYKDQKIVRVNERITRLVREKLLSLARYKRTKLIQSDLVQFLLPPLGRLFFVAFPILFFGFYLYHFRRNIFVSNSALILFGILLSGLVISLDIVNSQSYLSPYLVPITIASMLVTIAFDLETGIFLTFTGAILIGILSGFKMDVAFVGMVAGIMATFSVRKVRHRHEFYRSIFYLAIVYFGLVYIIESLKLTPNSDLWRHTGLGGY